MEWVIEFDIAAFIIIAIILGLFIVKKNYPSRVNKMYLYLMLAGLLSSLTDVASVYAIVYARQIPIWVNLIVNTLFLLFMNVIPFIYYFGSSPNLVGDRYSYHRFQGGIVVVKQRYVKGAVLHFVETLDIPLLQNYWVPMESMNIIAKPLL